MTSESTKLLPITSLTNLLPNKSHQWVEVNEFLIFLLFVSNALYYNN